MTKAKDLQNEVCRLDALFEKQCDRFASGEITPHEFAANTNHILEKQKKLNGQISIIRLEDFKNGNIDTTKTIKM